MKPIKHVFLAALTLAALSAGAWAEDSASGKPAANAPAAAAAPVPITAADVQSLKDALAAQQKQIEILTQQLQRIQAGNQPNQPTNDDAATVQNASESSSRTPTLQPAVLQTQQPQQPTEEIVVVEQSPLSKQMEGPLTIHFKGINITPGGFVAAEFLRRSRALGADIVTPFNNVTMPGASQSSLPEFFGTARQTRPTVYIASREGHVDFSGYISGDFLSSGVTSTATQTNGYTFRIRQAWGQAKFPGGWSFLGGQMWSLLTENKAGIAPSDDPAKTTASPPATIDGGYNVVFTFARQDAVRVTKDFGSKVAVAFAVENAQATVTTSGNTNDYVLDQAGARNTYNTTSTYGFNPSPDLIAKIAFDPGFGHYEIFGLSDRFQDRVFPCEDYSGTLPAATAVLPACPSLANAGTTTADYNSSKSGGGVGANARWAFNNN